MLGLHSTGSLPCSRKHLHQKPLPPKHTSTRKISDIIIAIDCRSQTAVRQKFLHVCLAKRKANDAIEDEDPSLLDEAEESTGAAGDWDAALEHIDDDSGINEDDAAVAEAAEGTAAINTLQQYYEEDATGSITGLPPRPKPTSATIVRELVGEELQAFLDREAEAAYVAPTVTGRELTEQQQAEIIAKQGNYQAFQLEKVQLLVPETSDGQLVLAESLVVDSSGQYLVPDLKQGVAKQAQQYQVVPWCSTFFGDSLKNKEPFRHIVKLYFLPVLDIPGTYGIDLDEVYCFDGESSVLARVPVKKVEPIVDPVLRITREGLVMEDAGLATDPAHVAMGATATAMQSDHDETYEEVLQELDTDLIDDMEEMPDVTEADLM